MDTCKECGQEITKDELGEHFRMHGWNLVSRLEIIKRNMVTLTSLTPSGRMIGLEHITLNDEEVAYLKKYYEMNPDEISLVDYSEQTAATVRQLKSKGLVNPGRGDGSLSAIGRLYFEQHYLPASDRFYSIRLIPYLKEMIVRFDASKSSHVDVSTISREKFDREYIPVLNMLKEFHFMTFRNSSLYYHQSIIYQITDRARRFVFEVNIYEEMEKLLMSLSINDTLREDIIQNYKTMKIEEMAGDFRQSITYMNDVLEKVLKSKFGYDASAKPNRCIQSHCIHAASPDG